MRLRCCTEASQHSGYVFLIVFHLQLLLSENDACGVVLDKLCPQLRKDQETFISSLASFCCKKGKRKVKNVNPSVTARCFLAIFAHRQTQHLSKER